MLRETDLPLESSKRSCINLKYHMDQSLLDDPGRLDT